MHGQFFGKPLDQCMFLGELSLDGGVRPVRGALSAALAARDKGLKAIAVPEANAREAAVVEGVNVFALKSLPQANHSGPGSHRQHCPKAFERGHPVPYPGSLLLGLGDSVS